VSLCFVLNPVLLLCRANFLPSTIPRKNTTCAPFYIAFIRTGGRTSSYNTALWQSMDKR
jgi:hypothetical protein